MVFFLQIFHKYILRRGNPLSLFKFAAAHDDVIGVNFHKKPLTARICSAVSRALPKIPDRRRIEKVCVSPVPQQGAALAFQVPVRMPRKQCGVGVFL